MFFNSTHLCSQQWELFRSGQGLVGLMGRWGRGCCLIWVDPNPGKLQALANLSFLLSPQLSPHSVVFSLLGWLSTHFFSLIKNLSGERTKKTFSLRCE